MSHYFMDIRIALFEGLLVVLFMLCLWHAIKRKHAHLLRYWYVAELIGAFFFGLVLEWVNLSYFSIYHYGHFSVFIKTVPVAIGLLWAIVLYSSLYTSDCWKLPSFYQICLDGLLVFCLDLSIDPIAIRLQMWHWDVFSSQNEWNAAWYGVPYGNFYGWIAAALSFSIMIRLFRQYTRQLIYPLLVCLPAELLLYSALIMPYCNNGYLLIFILSFLVISVMIGMSQKNQDRLKPEGMMVMVPLSIQGFFMGCLMTPLADMRANILLFGGIMIVLRAVLDYFLSTDYQ